MARRIAVVDDKEDVHIAVRETIRSQGSQWAAQHFITGEQALECLPVARPDVVLMDVRMPGISGIDCVRGLKRLLPDLRVVMFTACSDSETILASLAAGACGYLVKPASPEQLIHALVAAAQGEPAFGKEAQRVMMTTFHRASALSSSIGLTQREREVMAGLTQNLADKEIAERLGISQHTVHVYLGKLDKKLGVRKREEAVRKFLGLP